MKKQLLILLVLFFYSFGQTFAIPVNESISNVSIIVFDEVNAPEINLSNATYIKNETFTMNNLSERRKNVESSYKSKFGKNWKIKWKKNSDVPKILHGNHNLGEKIDTKAKATRILQSFLAENKDMFKVNISELKLSRIIEDFNSFDVYYQQYYQSIPVEGARVSIVINKVGSIKTVGNGFHQNISISTVPKITKEEALQITNATYTVGETALVILPKKENESTTYYLTWKVPTERTIFYVDAITSKVVGKYLNELPDTSTISGTINGEVYPLDDSTYPVPYGTLPKKPLSNIRIWINDGSVWNVEDWTVYDGTYSKTVPYLLTQFGVSLDAEYYGAYSPVAMDRVSVVNCLGAQFIENCNGESLHYEKSWSSVVPGDEVHGNYEFPDDEDQGHQTNIYYNVIRAYEYYKSNFSHYQPFITAYSYFDYSASGQGIYIKMSKDKGRSSDTIIHEYTHAVTYNKKNGNLKDYCSHPAGCNEGYTIWSALEEGIARYFPLSLNHNSIYAEGFPRGDYACRVGGLPGAPPIEIDIADDSITQAADCNGDGLYADLEPNEWAVAGALWDIRDAFISEFGYEQGVFNADLLVWEALEDLRTDLGEFTPGDFYLNLLINDDDPDDLPFGGNSDPTDGTPHSFEIWQAFNNHGMQFDDTNPTATITLPAPAQIVYSSTVNVLHTATDDASGVDLIQVRLDTGSWINKNPSSTAHTFYDVSDGVHVVYVKAIDRAGNDYTGSVSFTVDSGGTGAIIQYKAHNMNEIVGDDDGNVEPGETIDLTVTLENTGTEDANGVSAILSTSNPDVTVIYDYSYFADLPPGSSNQGAPVYTFEVDSSAPLASTIYFNLDISDSGSHSWQDAFQIPIGGDIVLTTSKTIVQVDEVFTLTLQAKNTYPDLTNMFLHIDPLSGYIKKCLDVSPSGTCAGNKDVSENILGTHTFSSWVNYVRYGEFVYGNSVNVTVEQPPDTAPPTISISAPIFGSTINSSTIAVSWSGSDSGSGIDHYEIQLDNNGWINKGLEESHTFYSVDDGWHMAYVRAYDNSNNSATNYTNFFVDTSVAEPQPDIHVFFVYGYDLHPNDTISADIILQNEGGTALEDGIRIMVLDPTGMPAYKTWKRVEISAQDAIRIRFRDYEIPADAQSGIWMFKVEFTENAKWTSPGFRYFNVS